MTANVIAMPTRAPKPAELELRVVGAALALAVQVSDLEAAGLPAGDFVDTRCRVVWQLVRLLAAERGQVNAVTVFAAGQKRRVLGDSDAAWLEDLQHANLLSREGFQQVAGELRTLVRGRQLVAALEEQLQQIRSGNWHPARTAGTLEGLAQGLARDTQPDEDASGDVQEFLHARDTMQLAGKASLLPTYLQALDAEVGGFPQNLTVIAAAPGVGKSAVIASIIRAQLQRGHRLGLFGLEDGTQWITRRWLADDSGLLLREVGWKRGTTEQEERLATAAEKYSELLQRLTAYRHDTIDVDQMVMRASNWITTRGVEAIYVDNLTEVDTRSRNRWDQYWERVAECVRRMRNLAVRTKVPVIVLVHTTDEGQRQPGPPRPEAMAGGQAIFKRARLQLLLWQKRQELRCTIGKQTEGPAGQTLVLKRLFEAGLVATEGGEKVDLDAERAQERKRAADEKALEAKKRREAQRVERDAALEAKKAKEAEEKAAAKPAQLELGGAPRA